MYVLDWTGTLTVHYVFPRHSAAPYTIHSMRMYFDNHQVAYYNDGINGQPRMLYDFGAIRKDMKILAVILHHSHIRRASPSSEEGEVCLLVLSADGYLRVFNANNGSLLRSVFLSTAVSYRYLQWADYLHTVQVKSIQFSRQLARQRGVANEYTSSRLLVVAVFKVHPLELVACLSKGGVHYHFFSPEQIFGGDIQDASLNQDVLVVAHSTGYYRMYSLPWIIKHYSVVKATLGEWVELGGTRAGVMGETGFGVPLTLNITERPPLLFEVRSGSELGSKLRRIPNSLLTQPLPQRQQRLLPALTAKWKTGQCLQLLSTGRRGSCETLHYRLQVTVKEEGNCNKCLSHVFTNFSGRLPVALFRGGYVLRILTTSLCQQSKIWIMRMSWTYSMLWSHCRAGMGMEQRRGSVSLTTELEK
ncbi:DDB1- and CUL4-associated factor 17-like [Halichondria panicea]|uniref:DDB1- and CUL4-associated factor 17-like n=1 Tax=Halichondria panicea TaxID=6063 RepID=UPI00312B871F